MARDFSWTELLASLGGAAVGGTAGFFAGGPAGAIGGAGLGWGIGQQLSPGGFWSETAPSTVGRRAAGADLEEAAAAESRAMQSAIGQQLAQAIRRSDIGYAQRGFLRSGEAGEARNELGRAAIEAAARAQGQISLQKAGIAEQTRQFELGYELQVAQLEAQRQAAENQMYAQLAQAAATLLPDLISNWIGGGGESLGVPGSELPGQLPFNPQPWQTEGWTHTRQYPMIREW